MIFENCLIQAPDGTNLSRCGIKKLNWYLNNKLADLISDDPPIIRLKFEPSGREGLNDPFLNEGKPNICIVCGTNEDLTKHHIVPYSFVKHMNLKCKFDIIRDIMPVCRKCHNEYELKSFDKRKELAVRFDVPIEINKKQACKKNKIIGLAKTLIEQENIPNERKEEIVSEIIDFTGNDAISMKDIETLIKIKPNSNGINYSKVIANQIIDYDEFAKEWRIHFVETMNPKFLPSNFKIDRKMDGFTWIPKRLRD